MKSVLASDFWYPPIPPGVPDGWYPPLPVGQRAGPEPAPRKPWPAHATLYRELKRAYNAQSFMIWRYGVCFNTHVTISAPALGIVDDAEFAALLPKWNKALKSWLAVPAGSRTPGRWCKRARPHVAQEHLWMYVLEKSWCRGLHAHQLCAVPREVLKEFKAFTHQWWEREAVLAIDKEAICIRFDYARQFEEQHKRHVKWFGYLLKSASRETLITDHQGQPRVVGDVFALPPPRDMQQICAPQIMGISHKLSKVSQSEHVPLGNNTFEKFESRFNTSRDFSNLFDGWEFDAFDARATKRLIQTISLKEFF